MKLPKTSSYDESDAELLAEFISTPAPAPEQESTPPVEIGMVDELSSSEEDSLFHLSGYCVRAVIHNACPGCKAAVTATCDSRFDHLTTLKEFKAGALFKVNEKVFSMFNTLEKHIRGQRELILRAFDFNIRKHLIESSKTVLVDFDLPTCCSIKEKIITKFVTARIHFMCKKYNYEQKDNNNGVMGSKSMGMRMLADKKK